MASYRQSHGAGREYFFRYFLGCISLIGYALYLQLVKNLLPCPLCVVQRIAYWLVGLTALLAFFHSPGATGQPNLQWSVGALCFLLEQWLRCVKPGWCAIRRRSNAASARKKNF